MSQACISYGSLKNASSEAKHVANKLNKYVDNLNSQVYKKLSEYSGDCTSNIEQINIQINSKITDLQNRAEAYMEYSQDLLDLKDQCVATDKAVRSRVSELTASFKSNNGIKDSNVQNSINYFLTSVGNRSSCRRWLSDKKDEFRASKKYVFQRIEDWWDYEGGAQFIKGIAIGGLEATIALCAIAATVAGVVAAVVAGTLTGGAIVVAIAGLVSGLIAVGNAVVNIVNEKAAADATKNGDPATGRRRRDINSFQDYLRSSFYYGADGEKYEYNAGNYLIASGIDIVNTVCTVITVLDSAGKLIKNCYQWATTSKVEFSNLKSIKLAFSKEGQKAFWTKIGSNLSKMGTDVYTAFKMKNYGFFFNGIRSFFKKDVLVNLKNSYFNFDSVKDGISSIKSVLSVAKNVVNDGIAFNNIVDDFVLPSITVMTINTISEGPGGQMQFDFQDEHVTMDEVTGIVDKIKNKIIGSVEFENTTIGFELIDKLSIRNLNYTLFQEVEIL